MLVRWAERREAPVVYSLFRKLVIAEGSEPPNPSVFARAWAAGFRDQGFRFAVAEHEGQVVGIVSLHRHYSTWHAAPTVSLEDFFVLPEHRGQGIGVAMIGFAEEHTRSIGGARIELHVRRDNARAQALYQRHGFGDTPYQWYHRGMAQEGPPGAPPAAAAKTSKTSRRTRRRPGHRGGRTRRGGRGAPKRS